jgi:hypothetical protein
MIIVRLNGGLGNQMFQYAYAKSLSVGRKQSLWIDQSLLPVYPARNYALKVFNITAKVIPKLLSRFLFRLGGMIPERGCGYQILKGYWQSEDYFKKIEDIIRKEFAFSIHLGPKNKKLLEEITNSDSVSIHVRRGDYVSDPKISKHHIALSALYYKRAVKMVKSKISRPSFFIFSDDLKWCRKNLSFVDRAIFINNLPRDYIDMFLMSKCKHNVIADSSFSWWAAWLNSNNDKLVIAPKRWFKSELGKEKGILPKEWKKI